MAHTVERAGWSARLQWTEIARTLSPAAHLRPGGGTAGAACVLRDHAAPFSLPARPPHCETPRHPLVTQNRSLSASSDASSVTFTELWKINTNISVARRKG